jgi:hypothetical protein
VGDVSVRLEFDPRDYDDVTIAVLWADQIGASVERAAAAAAGLDRRGDALADTGRNGAGGQPAPSEPGRRDMPSAAQPGCDLGSAPRDPRMVGARPPEPWAVALLGLAEAGDRDALVRLAGALLDPRLREPLLDAFVPARAAAIARHLRELASPAGAGDGAGADAHPERAARAEDRGAAKRSAHHPAAARDGADGVDTTRLLEAAELLRDAREIALPLASGLLATSCSGLVLTYPWLGPLLTAAAAARPSLDPVAARRIALAAIVTPDPNAAICADPLIRLLAGDDLAVAPEPLAKDPGAQAAQDAAQALLRRLAVALPGFTRSSPEFVRRELIVRPGTLDLAADPVRIALASAALDVVLALLPYPLGMFRLAWTPTLTIRLDGR